MSARKSATLLLEILAKALLALASVLMMAEKSNHN